MVAIGMSHQYNVKVMDELVISFFISEYSNWIYALITHMYGQFEYFSAPCTKK